MWEQHDIDMLRRHWGDRYAITHYPGGKWMAVWGASVLVADTAEDLIVAIRADYEKRTAPKPTDQGSL
jgi:hypothetical protein